MENLVMLAKIFSDINRVKIIALVLRDEEVCVCEICDTLELSQPLVSRHLKQIKQADILEARQEGKWVIYSLSKTPSPFLVTFLTQIKALEVTLPKLISCNKL